jgi:hypothetical protein
MLGVSVYRNDKKDICVQSLCGTDKTSGHMHFSKMILLMVGTDHLGVCIPRLKKNMKGGEKG